MSLHVIPDDSDPLSMDELKTRGDALLAGAGKAALKAMRASARPEFIIGKSLTVADVRGIHRSAQEALTAWRDVEATLAELLRDVDKAKAARP